MNKEIKTVIFNCSPSLGVLDSWISVIVELKKSLPDAKFIFYTSVKGVIEQVNLKSILIAIAEENFDEIIFESNSGVQIQTNTFSNAIEFQLKSKSLVLEFLIRVFRKARFVKLQSFCEAYYYKRTMKQMELDVGTCKIYASKETIILCDIEECQKQYNKNFYKYYANSLKFSILHGLNVNGLRTTREIEAVNGYKDNSIVYIFSEKERDFYKKKFELSDRSIKLFGIPRHEPQWVKQVLSKVDEDIPFGGGYVFIISRPEGRTLPREKKEMAIRDIAEIAKKYQMKLVIKMHPRELGCGLYEKVLGKESYGESWAYSSLHPFVLAKNSALAIAFYSGVTIDLAALGVPVIEFLDLRDLPEYENESFLVDSNGDPITEYRYFGVVLGAKNLEELNLMFNRVLDNRAEVVNGLRRNYEKIFPVIDDVNMKISLDISEEFKSRAFQD